MSTCLSTLKAQNILTLKKKVEVHVIKATKKNPKFGVRKLADLFKCGRTQIFSFLKNSESILELYEGNVASESIRS